MPGFREIFEAYGADYEGTLPRFLGKEDLYLRFLDMLLKDETLQRLGEALEADDGAGAFEAAHTLKGVVGNMGLTPLYQAVCALVGPLRAGERREDYPAMYRAVRLEFQKAEALREDLKRGRPA